MIRPGVYRVRGDKLGYSRISDTFARDGELSARGRSVGLYMLSHRDGFVMRQEAIATHLEISVMTLRAAFADLAERGYMRSGTARDGQRLIGTWYMIHDEQLTPGQWDAELTALPAGPETPDSVPTDPVCTDSVGTESVGHKEDQVLKCNHTAEQGNQAGLPASPRARAGEAPLDPTPPAGMQARREHPSPAELNATATRHGGYQHVATWALNNPGLTTAQQRKLAKAVDDLLAQCADPNLIPAALDEAHRPEWRNPVASLPHAYDRIRRDAHPSPPAPNRTPPRQSATARAHAEVDAAFDALGYHANGQQPHFPALPGGTT